MGQSPSKSPSKTSPTKALAPITNYNPNYDLVKKYDDPHYGEIGLIKEQLTNRQMLLKKVVANSKEGYEAELHVCQQRGTLTNDNIVRVIGYSHEEKKNFCSDFHNLLIYIEHYEKTLYNSIQEAMVNQFFFSEPEILFLAENLISCLSYFQNQGLTHGDIRPFNVFIGSDGYKLSDPTLGPQKNFNSYHAALIGGHKTFVAPELLKPLAEKEHDVKINHKYDVFSLGATLLSVATLTNSEDLFNYEKGTINDDLINERLDKVRSRYSPFTYELIRDMLIIDQARRPDFVDLEAKLNPHKEAIRSRTPIYTNHPITDHDDILKRVAEQLARSQQLRASIENGTFSHEAALQGRIL